MSLGQHDAEIPALRQLLDVYEFYGASVVALMEVPGDAISAYGVVDAEPMSHSTGKDRLFRIRNMVEKPKPSEAPSNLAIIGRYVLTSEVFQSIEAIEPGSGGETFYRLGSGLLGDKRAGQKCYRRDSQCSHGQLSL